VNWVERQFRICLGLVAAYADAKKIMQDRHSVAGSLEADANLIAILSGF